jgi:hexokinase
VRVCLQKPVKTSRQSTSRNRGSILFGGKPVILSREVPIPEALLKGTADALFDFMAENLLAHAAKIAATEGPPTEGGGRPKFNPGQFFPNIGFTFSYPCEQTSLRAGTLVKWTKGFSASGAEGQDVVQLLQRALKRAGCPGASIKALVNDTVGTLAAAMHKDKAAVIGMILGTGTNAAYVERLDRIEKLHSAGGASPDGKMVINCEWGNARSPSFPFVEADFEVDNMSPNPGQQTFEKMVSGLYLGDLARRSLIHLVRDGVLQGLGVSSELQQALQAALLKSALPTSLVSDIDAAEASLEGVRTQMKAALGVQDCPDAFCALSQSVFASLRQRSGRMVAAGLAAILDNHSAAWGDSEGRRRVVAVDGGLYEHYPRLRAAIREGLDELLGADANVELIEGSDGSGLGEALLAASALSDNYS